MHPLAHCDAVLEELAGLDAETVALRQRLREIAARQDVLRSQLAATEPIENASGNVAPPIEASPSLAITPTAKIALFRSLFRGRTDIYPKHWTNPKKNTSGYAPACHNEWIRGVCEKPRVKCGECPNQAFIPVADAVIQRHLQGGDVFGVYPL